MLSPEDPALIHLLLALVLQGADGNRGLKGSKGEKVEEAGAFFIFLKWHRMGLYSPVNWILCPTNSQIILRTGRGWFPGSQRRDGREGRLWRKWCSR